MNNTTEFDYKDDLVVNADELHIEWMKHPQNIMNYIEYAATSKREMEEAKETLDVEMAKTALTIRKSPEDFGLTKVTEGSISELLTADEQLRKLRMELIQKREHNDIMQGVVRSFDHKKSALENLCRLLGIEYFASPNVPKDIEKATQTLRDEKSRSHTTRKMLENETKSKPKKSRRTK